MKSKHVIALMVYAFIVGLYVADGYHTIFKDTITQEDLVHEKSMACLEGAGIALNAFNDPLSLKDMCKY